ncbi:hypothetical protein TRIUR3_07614 [Triticum urartu]|uniref:CRAL/TRIO N-terminal domain-containing protein n=1 Tax=Triticum urartu TaxID=4572 RepID=M7ZUY2_TRIUA|nr:hypothetical protein TRIUR3_07614 [Triticum urartu]
MSDQLKKTARSQEATQQKASSSEEQQQEKINEVRGLLGSLTEEMPSFMSDATIRRFLRARNWSTEQATKGLKETVKWRRDYRPDAISWDDVAEMENEVRRTHVADYLDKNGRSVLVSNVPMKIAKNFVQADMKEKVKFVYANKPESLKTIADIFDLDTLESSFGGRSTRTAFDINKYAERMRRADKMRGASKDSNGHNHN